MCPENDSVLKQRGIRKGAGKDGATKEREPEEEDHQK
jgi:hypothetical protein